MRKNSPGLLGNIGVLKQVKSGTSVSSSKDYEKLRKVLLNRVLWAFIIAVVLLGILVYTVGSSNSSTVGPGSSIDAGVRPEASDGGGDSSGMEVAEARRYRHDSNVSTGEVTLTDSIGGHPFTGAYSKDYYEYSERVSNALSKKYGVPFSFYYMVGRTENGTAVMTGGTIPEGKYIYVNERTDGLYDTLYEYISLSEETAQLWYDEATRDIAPEAMYRVPKHGRLLGPVDVYNASDVQNYVGSDVVFIVSDTSDIDSRVGSFARIVGKPQVGYRIYVHTLSDYTPLYGESKVTSENYSKILNISSTITYVVSPDGSVKIEKK